jgi:hypothetical protein
VKRAVPVRMPDWDEKELPTTKQIDVYLLFWDRQQKQLARDPGIGFIQESFWLDPEVLEVSAYEAGCLRAGHPDRARFIRRLIATYHKRKSSDQISVDAPAVLLSTTETALTASPSLQRQVLRPSTRIAYPETELSPAKVNEVSRAEGLGICWQPGNVYRIGRTVNQKTCLVQFDCSGRELARYGSW